jgi:hypothetical protein
MQDVVIQMSLGVWPSGVTAEVDHFTRDHAINTGVLLRAVDIGST